jgi:hypothetical protein
MKFLLTFIILLSLYGQNGFSQINDQIIDPINNECFRLASNEKIKPLILEGVYYGKIMIEAECDTINGILKNYKLVFAKLHSKIDPNDSIEIRLDVKIGNYRFIEEQKANIIEHISGLRVKRNPVVKCVSVPRFTFPVKIESKN